MKLRLDSARFEPFRWQEEIPIGPAELDQPGLVSMEPVEAAGTLSFVAPDFLLEMDVRSRAAVECDRCLRPVEVELAGSLVLSVVSREARRPAKSVGQGERELSEGELGVLEVEGDSFESAPLVREQMLLELPVKPLCREDCAGLCPMCGADLNLGACDCDTRGADPRWAALAEVRNKLGGGA